MMMNKTIFLIEDDIQLNHVISEFFQIKGYNVLSFHDGHEALEGIQKRKAMEIALYIIDINLPTYNGLEILEYIRTKDVTTPIMMITASLEVDNLINAFDAGCSEYIKKPFHIKELHIRSEKLLNNDENILRFQDDFYYHCSEKNFYYKEIKIELRNQEQKLIEVLIQNKNTIVPVEIIYEYVWNDNKRDTFPLRQLLADIRRKLPYDIIQTKVKQGYMISINHDK